MNTEQFIRESAARGFSRRATRLAPGHWPLGLPRNVDPDAGYRVAGEGRNHWTQAGQLAETEPLHASTRPRAGPGPPGTQGQTHPHRSRQDRNHRGTGGDAARALSRLAPSAGGSPEACRSRKPSPQQLRLSATTNGRIPMIRMIHRVLHALARVATDPSSIHCPAHPAVEQAGGDERAKFEYWAVMKESTRRRLSAPATVTNWRRRNRTGWPGKPAPPWRSPPGRDATLSGPNPALPPLM